MSLWFEAYTHYSFFEWALIAFDIMYDSVSGLDFQEANLQVSLMLVGLAIPHTIHISGFDWVFAHRNRIRGVCIFILLISLLIDF